MSSLTRIARNRAWPSTGSRSCVIAQDTSSLSNVFNLSAAHFGVGQGTGGYAPNEYLIDSTNSKVAGLDVAVRSFVEYLYAP
jgi:hypothetical protein